MPDDMNKAIRQVVSSIEKRYGKGAIMALGDDSPHEAVGTIPSGAMALDDALGVGG